MKIIKYILFAAGLFYCSSCANDFLDTKPTNQIDEEVVLSSLSNMYASINGTHRALVKQYLSNQDCGGEPSFCIFRDVMGEDLVHPSSSSSWFRGALRWVDHRNESARLARYGFHFYYKFVLNANLILANIDNVDTSDEKLYNCVKGEALCFRGWAHFNLVQLYGERYDATKEVNDQLGVPYRKEPEFGEMARNTVEECYQYINEDIDAAIEALKNAQATEVTHFSLKVAYGLKARVMLAQQNYAKAAEYADLALQTAEADGNKLMQDDELMHGFATITSDTKEAMWAANTYDDHSVYFYSYYAYMSWNFNSSALRSTPRAVNSNLYELISETDIRKQWWDPTGKAGVPSSSYSQYPYQNRKYTAKSTASAVGDYPFMRLAEIYLMKMEALARNGRLNEAQETLTTFALTRDPEYVAKSTTADELIEEIMIQRRVELWGEGFRFTDLKRLNLPLDRENSNHTATIAQVLRVEPGDKRWQYVIPISEMNANPAMEQNPL